MIKPDPAFIARLDRVQAGAEGDVDHLAASLRMLRAAPDGASREVDLAQLAHIVQKSWTPSRTAFALLAAIDRLDREGA